VLIRRVSCQRGRECQWKEDSQGSLVAIGTSKDRSSLVGEGQQRTYLEVMIGTREVTVSRREGSFLGSAFGARPVKVVEGARAKDLEHAC